MRTVAIAEAESRFASLLDEVEREPLAIERDGNQVAFIVSPAEYATTRRARGQALLTSLDAIHAEIEARMSRGEFGQDDLDELEKSLDRKAS